MSLASLSHIRSPHFTEFHAICKVSPIRPFFCLFKNIFLYAKNFLLTCFSVD
jgi:hypothetical protein